MQIFRLDTFKKSLLALNTDWEKKARHGQKEEIFNLSKTDDS